MQKTTATWTILGLILALSTPAMAKDMTHRLGVGFTNNLSVSLPSVSGVYYAEKNLAYTGSVGIDTEKNNTAFQASGGVRYVVFFENNLNCYVAGQGSVINLDTPSTGKTSGLEILGLGGVEFFFTGLENLSFTAEAGLGLSTLGSTTRIYTTALDPFRAGINFYF